MDFTSTTKKIILILCLLLVFAGALVGLYLIFGKMGTLDRAKLLLEASKALFQITVALIVGVFISAVIKSFTNSRKADKALHDFRLEFLNQLQAAYQRVKRCRRVLRASGLTEKFGSATITLSSTQIDSYGREMDVLNDAQLELERLKLEIGHFPDSFSGHEKLTASLGGMESYLRDILHEYERFWSKLQTQPGQTPFKDFDQLKDFTGSYAGSEFKANFAVPYDTALALIRQELLPLRAASKEDKISGPIPSQDA